MNKHDMNFTLASQTADFKDHSAHQCLARQRETQIPASPPYTQAMSPCFFQLEPGSPMNKFMQRQAHSGGCIGQEFCGSSPIQLKSVRPFTHGKRHRKS